MTQVSQSDEICQFIEKMVEAIVIEQQPIDNKLKYLRRYCIVEGLNYQIFEEKVSTLIEAFHSLRLHESKDIERSIRSLANECYFSEEKILSLISTINNLRKGESLFLRWTERPKGELDWYEKEQQAFPLLYESATLGYPRAQFNLAKAYQSSLGVERNYTEAFKWAMAAARQNHPGAQVIVGQAYLYGKGVEPDDTQAYYWLNRQAMYNNPYAMTYLALCYLYGFGTKRDIKSANDLIAKAGELLKSSDHPDYPSRVVRNQTLEIIEECRKDWRQTIK